MDIARIIQKPLLNEKLNKLRANGNFVSFKVHPKANKLQIKKTIEKLFSVSVLEVRTMNVKGKIKKQGRFEGKRSDWKKAFIVLKTGDKIEYFEGV